MFSDVFIFAVSSVVILVSSCVFLAGVFILKRWVQMDSTLLLYWVAKRPLFDCNLHTEVQRYNAETPLELYTESCIQAVAINAIYRLMHTHSA